MDIGNVPRSVKSVDGLRAGGALEDLPPGSLARAAFRRSVGEWNGAARDLDEVEETAEPGPIKLFLCDLALERARLAFAQIEGFAPLNGLVDGSPPLQRQAQTLGNVPFELQMLRSKSVR